MKDDLFAEFDLELIYRKLTAPSKPRMIKACDFFKLPDLLTPLQDKIARLHRHKSDVDEE